MKTSKHIAMILLSAAFVMLLASLAAYSQQEQGPLAQIIIYKGEAAGTGTGITNFKLTVGEEMTVTAKGVDEEGNDVPIWPTWKADKELSINVVEGKSKMAVAKALKEGAPVFITAIYVTDDEK